MALRRAAETGHGLHLCHDESFPPGRDGPLFIYFLCIAVPQALTVPVTDTLIADLKDDVIQEARSSKSGGDGTMVTLYGLRQSSAVGSGLVGELVASFVDVLYKAQ